MDNQVKRIYDLLYSPIITPYNLLENAKLPNYSYVNYYKGESGITCEMKCTVEQGVDAVFYYHFDLDDKLQKVYMEESSMKHLVFDRQTELAGEKQKFKSRERKKVSKKAV